MIDLQAAAAVELELSPVPSEQVLAGNPSTGFAPLGLIGGNEFGVWEMTSGAMSDVEVEELFVVVAGRGTLRIGDEIRELEPGSVGRFAGGEQTEWVVTERLRKVYVAGTE